MIEKESRNISQATKEKVLKRQKFFCASRNCAKIHNGKKMKVDLYAEFHHKKPFCMGGSSKANNIICLCPGCHRIQTRIDKEKIAKWKKKKQAKPSFCFDGSYSKLPKQKIKKIKIPKSISYYPPFYDK